MTKLISRDHIEQHRNVSISSNMHAMINTVVVRCVAGYHKYAICVSSISDACSVHAAIEESRRNQRHELTLKEERTRLEKPNERAC